MDAERRERCAAWSIYREAVCLGCLVACRCVPVELLPYHRVLTGSQKVHGLHKALGGLMIVRMVVLVTDPHFNVMHKEEAQVTSSQPSNGQSLSNLQLHRHCLIW